MKQKRQLEVLRAIVEDYVHSREPVGSKALIERHHLGVSSATVRNDMAYLEEAGLISAPHASAGRIPTKAGYRLFVDQLVSVKPLTEPQRRAISSFLDGSHDVHQLMERTVKLLSHLTHQVAVIQYPTAPQPIIRHVDVVHVADTQLMVFVVLSTSEILQRTVQIPEVSDSRPREIIALANFLRSQLVGKTGEAIQSLSIPLEISNDFSLSVAEAVTKMLEENRSSRVAIAGTSYLAQATEDFPHSIAPILYALEEQVVVLRLLEELTQDQRGFSVKIGAEDSRDPLTETAVVATGYGQDYSAKIGIVGPTRMDYPAHMAQVRAVASYLSQTLNHS